MTDRSGLFLISASRFSGSSRTAACPTWDAVPKTTSRSPRTCPLEPSRSSGFLSHELILHATPARSLLPGKACRYPLDVTENVERTGRRKVTRLSSIARTVKDVRHVDIDLTQWCPQCKRPQIFAEVKSYPVRDAEWDQMRRHAKHYGHGCIAILVIETPDGSLGVKIYSPQGESISGVNWGGEEYLRKVLEKARDIHVCW